MLDSAHTIKPIDNEIILSFKEKDLTDLFPVLHGRSVSGVLDVLCEEFDPQNLAPQTVTDITRAWLDDPKNQAIYVVNGKLVHVNAEGYMSMKPIDDKNIEEAKALMDIFKHYVSSQLPEKILDIANKL